MLIVNLKLLLCVILLEVGCTRQPFLHNYVLVGTIVLYRQVGADFGPLVDVISELNGQANVNGVMTWSVLRLTYLFGELLDLMHWNFDRH